MIISYNFVKICEREKYVKCYPRKFTKCLKMGNILCHAVKNVRQMNDVINTHRKTCAIRQVLFFFARIGRSDLTKKLEKVGPFECDELEKHCRVSAKCYPTKVPAVYLQNDVTHQQTAHRAGPSVQNFLVVCAFARWPREVLRSIFLFCC